MKIIRIRRLRIAGYPIRADDLAVAEWGDLGLLEEYEKLAGAQRPRPVIMVKP